MQKVDMSTSIYSQHVIYITVTDKDGSAWKNNTHVVNLNSI